MGNFWFWLIFWVLIAIILTGVILFIVGYAAPHKDKPDNTVNYDSFKWIGVGLLIFGGLGMLVWLYVKFRGNKSKTIESSVLQEPLIEKPLIQQPYSFGDCNNGIKNLKERAQMFGNTSPESNLYNDLLRYRQNYILENPNASNAKVNGSLCSKYRSQLGF